MSEQASVTIELEEDPTPLVRATSADLAACLGDPGFAAETARLEGSVSIRSAATPEAVTVRLGDGVASIAHGRDPGAVAEAVIDPEAPEPQVSGAEEHPRLAGWLAGLLDPPLPTPAEAAERFWTILEPMEGAPGALLVVECPDGERRLLGSERAEAYEIHGGAGALVRVLTGRVPLPAAAFEGAVFIRGSFRQLSVLAGAGFAARYGEGDG